MMNLPNVTWLKNSHVIYDPDSIIDDRPSKTFYQEQYFMLLSLTDSFPLPETETACVT